MKIIKGDKTTPDRITRIVIEASDLMVEGMGIEIQVQGFKGSPEEYDENNTHVYVETWEGQTQILVWNKTSEPKIFKLEESEERIVAGCGHEEYESEIITHEGVTCCLDCYDRIK